MIQDNKQSCAKCCELKYLQEFHRNRHTATGYSVRCKLCTKQYENVRRESVKRVVITEKQCAKCNNIKPATMFSKHPTGTFGLCSWCKDCSATERRRDYRNRPEAFKKHNRQSTLKQYGLTEDQFDDLLLHQQNKCRICDVIFIKTPHVDHCHTTGRVRALLCAQCNTGLGLFKNSVEIFLKAIIYIQQN